MVLPLKLFINRVRLIFKRHSVVVLFRLYRLRILLTMVIARGWSVTAAMGLGEDVWELTGNIGPGNIRPTLLPQDRSRVVPAYDCTVVLSRSTRPPLILMVFLLTVKFMIIKWFRLLRCSQFSGIPWLLLRLVKFVRRQKSRGRWRGRVIFLPRRMVVWPTLLMTWRFPFRWRVKMKVITGRRNRVVIMRWCGSAQR